VDAINLFKTFLREPETRAKVIEKYDDVTSAYLKQLEDAKAKVEKVAKETDNSATSKQQIDVLKSSIDDVKKAVAKAKTDATGLGVPISWTEERIKSAKNIFDGYTWLPAVYIPGSITAVFGLLLGGLLIGLGAPFWFDMVKSLWNVRRVTAAARGAGALDQTTETRSEHQPGSAQPVQPLEIFRIAYEARHGKLP
jgi:hypothetical protein